MSASSDRARAIAIIPARGGSKGVPRKNLRAVGGATLVARAVRSAMAASSVDLVVVTTDDGEIAAAARDAGADVVDRPAALSGDAATSESALLHAIARLAERGVVADVTVFVQATSPFIEPADVDAAVLRVQRGEADVVLAAAPFHGFVWAETDAADGAAAIDHDRDSRPRRQDREPRFLETGAFYVLRTAGFVAAGHRFFGRVELGIVDPAKAVEIDDEHDLELADALSRRSESGATVSNAAAGLERITAIVTDFDGVHTDDTALIAVDGTESVRVSRADGHGVRMLRDAGVPLVILTAERNEVVLRRGEKLGVEVIAGADGVGGHPTKADALAAWVERASLDPSAIAYLGNDLADLAPMAMVGLSVAVADAHERVLEIADLVLDARGGDGAVRELADRLLEARAARAQTTTTTDRGSIA